MYTWHSLAYHADEWFVAYSCAPHIAPGVMFFTVGHAFELYLKAVHTKLTGDIDKAIRFGHQLKSLWDACKKLDAGFLPNLEIRDTLFAIDFLDGNAMKQLPIPDQLHFISQQNLYLVTKHLPDLKYMGLPWKTRTPGRGYSFVFAPLDPFWLALFRELRRYLGHPDGTHADFIEQSLTIGSLPVSAVEYLNGIYEDGA